MQRKPNAKCSICDTLIYRRPSQITNGGVFCSSACTGKSQRKPKRCPICSKEFLGGKKNCSRTCANKARTGITYTKEGKFYKAYRGTLLKEKLANTREGACEKCGENNYAILQVHHKVERQNGGSNELSNLELLCPNCHATHHYGRSLFKPKKMI